MGTPFRDGRNPLLLDKTVDLVGSFHQILKTFVELKWTVRLPPTGVHTLTTATK